MRTIFKRKSFILSFLIIMVMSLLLSGCGSQSKQTASSNTNSYSGKPAKYVFLFIGDGMGMPQVSSAEIYKGSIAKSDNPNIKKLDFTQFPAQGMQTTYEADSFIPDSASTGTSIATGFKTNDGIIAMDPSKKIKYTSTAEKAKANGMKVGIVSSVSIDHATPAVFYAHNPSRNNYYDIAMELTKSNFDYFAGGGFLQPKGKNGDKPDVIEEAKKNGYKYVTTKEDFQKLDSKSGKVIAVNPVLDKAKALPYSINNNQNSLTLADFTKKGIELLDNPKGFFMMVEGGKIDWSGHANDAATNIYDTMALDNAVAEAMKFYDKHPDETLIVVTADHETGGMTIGFAGTKYETYYDILANQKISYDEFDKKVEEYKKSHTPENAKIEDLLPLIKENFGLTVLTPDEKTALENKAKNGDKEAAKQLQLALNDQDLNSLKAALALNMKDKKERGNDQQTYLLYGGYEPLSVTLTHILNQKAGIGWTSYSHTGVPVPVYAKGVGQELFQGYYDNTDIAKKFLAVMGVSKS
ncbi:alkaline phosphatase [Aceticella autotrophica]|uniref:Alkaline phosphatase n=1 Tax=Aceticella autotrophica TaxID=2755338 RepID=A0A975AW88_9THEO|nr:alkaline phosphatase [Aceticella autotrophica]QSZ27637.1 alkaline phosphatase [Aceticella autotrophica]